MTLPRYLIFMTDIGCGCPNFAGTGDCVTEEEPCPHLAAFGKRMIGAILIDNSLAQLIEYFVPPYQSGLAVFAAWGAIKKLRKEDPNAEIDLLLVWDAVKRQKRNRVAASEIAALVDDSPDIRAFKTILRIVKKTGEPPHTNHAIWKTFRRNAAA